MTSIINWPSATDDNRPAASCGHPVQQLGVVACQPARRLRTAWTPGDRCRLGQGMTSWRTRLRGMARSRLVASSRNGMPRCRPGRRAPRPARLRGAGARLAPSEGRCREPSRSGAADQSEQEGLGLIVTGVAYARSGPPRRPQALAPESRIWQIGQRLQSRLSTVASDAPAPSALADFNRQSEAGWRPGDRRLRRHPRPRREARG